MKALTLRLRCSGEFMAHELMRFTLNEIVRRHEEDRFGFSGEEAAELASAALEKANELESNDVT